MVNELRCFIVIIMDLKDLVTIIRLSIQNILVDNNVNNVIMSL